MSTSPDIQTLPENSCDDLSARDQRSLIIHLLYAMDSFEYDVSLESILDNFSRGFNCTLTPDSSIIERAQSIIEKRDELDDHLGCGVPWGCLAANENGSWHKRPSGIRLDA